MADSAFDYAVCGNSPFATLLAGLLASVHGRSVCLVGDPWSPYRLVRHHDIAVMPATRPETWSLLRSSGAAAGKLVGSIGRGLYERVDPLFVAETPAQASYLGHMRWMAAGFGLAAERVVDRTLTDPIGKVAAQVGEAAGLANDAVSDRIAALAKADEALNAGANSPSTQPATQSATQSTTQPAPQAPSTAAKPEAKPATQPTAVSAGSVADVAKPRHSGENEDVRRLHVAMDDALGVQMGEHPCEIRDQPQAILSG